MQLKKIKLSILLFFSLGFTGLYAQETIPVTGSNASGTGGTESYTVGQTIYSVISGTNGSVAQGVQQPYEISDITGLEEAKDITLHCSAYPNPASDLLTLRIENFDFSNLSYQIIDMKGRVLVNKKNDGKETMIDMKNIVAGTYFLKVYTKYTDAIQSNKEIKTFKIIKQQ